MPTFTRIKSKQEKMMDPLDNKSSSNGYFVLRNHTLHLSIRISQNLLPHIESLRLASKPDVNWAATDHILAPALTIQGTNFSIENRNMTFHKCLVKDYEKEIQLLYQLDNGLQVTLHLKISPDKAVWRSWLTLMNAGDQAIDGITRFDAANFTFSTGNMQPYCSYVLGWMEGPRADAPGRQALPFKYGGWIPKFLYGEGFVIPPPPEGGWVAPVYRLVTEKLEKLPLRSGKRSTYENHPWVAVMDPERQGGWFLGFEWSGTWKIDADYLPGNRVTTVSAYSVANTHVLKPGESLSSPATFIGLFSGDWDDCFNACRYYVDDEIIPKIKPIWPTSLHVYYFHNTIEKGTDEFIRKEIDAAAEAGFETTYVETIWWEEGAQIGEFSYGLGNFNDNRRKFPMGLRGMSDYVHSKGMNFGVWFEIERVDIRTANRLRNPWKPEWILQQNGYPYRSWCPHVFLLCLGVKAAAEWALENLTWAIRQYNIDYIMFDSNEWAICDDPNHDHGPCDGEWAQIQGYYFVMQELRKAFPDLMIMNSSGGSQRGDFGIARYSNCIHPHDNAAPSSKQRHFMHGTGCMYPTSFQASVLPDYNDLPSDNISQIWQQRPIDRLIDPKRFEWRVLNRLMGYFAIGLEVSALPDFQREILKKGIDFYKRIRRCTHGDRYVLAGPRLLFEPYYWEADNWEAYQYVSRERDLSVVYFYRCLSPQTEISVKLRGLDPQAQYLAEFYSGAPGQNYSGVELMEQGFTCRLPEQRSAEIMQLIRR
jgi:alpha-galactosidase